MRKNILRLEQENDILRTREKTMKLRIVKTKLHIHVKQNKTNKIIYPRKNSNLVETL